MSSTDPLKFFTLKVIWLYKNFKKPLWMAAVGGLPEETGLSDDTLTHWPFLPLSLGLHSLGAGICGVGGAPPYPSRGLWRVCWALCPGQQGQRSEFISA